MEGRDPATTKWQREVAARMTRFAGFITVGPRPPAPGPRPAVRAGSGVQARYRGVCRLWITGADACCCRRVPLSVAAGEGGRRVVPWSVGRRCMAFVPGGVAG